MATLLVERFDRFGLPFQIFGAPSDRLWALEARFPGRTTSRLEEIAYDEWLVALKTNQNEAKIRTLRGGRPRAILVLQNGLGPERQWATLSSQVGRALSTYGVKSIAPGRIEGGEFGEMTVVEGLSLIHI